MIKSGYVTVNRYLKPLVTLALAFVLSGISQEGYSQSFDYSSYPKLDFSFNHLALVLNVDAENSMLEGQADYDVQANIGGVDSLVLHAAHMEINAVQVGGEEVPYRMRNDSLIIDLQQSAERGQQFTVGVTYQTSPKFGVHFADDGTVWSSMLPLSTRHWVPVVDHPRVAFTTEITLLVPGSAATAAPGRLEGEQVTSVERKEVRWVSNRAVPANALWFATGSLESMQTSFGVKQIRVTGNRKLMEQSGRNLLERAYELLGTTEESLGVEYPFQTLQLVLLEDHTWETKQYGAGVIFIYENRGSLQAQLQRGIFAQWFGVMQREEQWSDAEAMTLYQTVLNQLLMAGSANLLEDKANPETSVNPYHAFSPSRWNRWQKFYNTWPATTWKQQIEESLNSDLVNNTGVKTWSDYAETWYEQSGQPWFSPPELVLESQQGQVRPAGRDSIIYQVNYQYNETSGELTLNFEAQKGMVTELVALPFIQHTAQSTDTLEVTFTGESESVMFSLDPAVTYVDIDASRRDDLVLREYKPVSFLLSQLRNAESTEEKVEAARQLGNHAENPDIQLAITDFLSRNQAPEVKAALLESLGDITRGAAGTEQQFLDAIRDDHPAIKQAAARALRHYSGNSQVIQQLQQLAVASDTVPLFKTATNSLLAVVDSSDTTPISEYARQIINQDSTGQKSVYVFRKLAERGMLEGNDLVKNLDLLIGHSYAFPVRADALRLLIKVDDDQSRWTTRVENLLLESDPRIRYLAVRAIAQKEFLDATELLKDRVLDEYDGRVFYEMRKLL